MQDVKVVDGGEESTHTLAPDDSWGQKEKHKDSRLHHLGCKSQLEEPLVP